MFATFPLVCVSVNELVLYPEVALVDEISNPTGGVIIILAVKFIPDTVKD